MKRLVLGLVLVSAMSAGGVTASASAAAAEEPEDVTAATEPAAAPGPEPVEPEPVAPAAQPAPIAVAPASPAPIPLTSLPPTMRYRSDQAPPPGYVLEEQTRRGLLIPGIAVVGALYITGIITTGVLQDFPNKTGFLAIPVAGPWITLTTRDSACDNDDLDTSLDSSLECDEDKALDRLLVIDGLVQAIGTALIVTGLTWTKSVWVREDLASINFVPGINVAKLPGLPQPQGLSLVGRF